jgi:hypothetical protein
VAVVGLIEERGFRADHYSAELPPGAKVVSTK